MRSKIASKSTAILLSLCIMIGTFCGVMPNTVFAESDSGENITYNDFHLLGRGFNLLSDKQLENSYLESGLLKSDNGMNATRTYIGKTYQSYSVITDMQEYFQKKVEDWDVNIDAKAKIWSTAVGMKMKYKSNTSLSYSDAKSSYYSMININAIAYKYDMDINGDYYLIWNNLNDRFKDRLINEQNLDALFDEYGTHMITRYQSGGWATSYSSAISESYDFNNAASASVNIETPINLGKIFEVNNNIRADRVFEEIGSDKGSVVTSSSEVYGGNNFFSNITTGTVNEAAYNEWLATLTARDAITGGNKTQIISDDLLEMVAIWDLLPDEYASRKSKLENYYNKKLNDNISDFYGTFIYKNNKTASIPDYSQYADYTWIYTPEELDAVRNNLGGKYFIINDLDLSGYSWEPIGTEEEPFTGELIGNDVEILGLTTLVSGNDTRFPGIVAYNSGKISGIDISKRFDYPVQVKDVKKGLEHSWTSISSLPASFNSDTHGATAVIDWTNETSSAVNKTFTVGNNVSSLYLKGKSGVKYTGLQIIVASRTTPLDIVFESFNYTAPSGKIALDATATTSRVSVIAQSGSNSIGGGSGVNGTSRGVASSGENTWSSSNINGTNATAGAVAVSGKNIVFEGSGSMTVAGGNGGIGGNGRSFEYVVQGNSNSAGYGGNGGNGGNGAIAILGDNIIFMNIGTLTANGGAGGAGGKGGTAPQSDRDGQATAGNGGTGGKGGAGAEGIKALESIEIYNTTKTLKFNSGIGGTGGAGGVGGEGDDKGDHYRDNGGKGGNGGNGGDGAPGLRTKIIRFSRENGLSRTNVISSSGGGAGGNGGNGGAAHKRDGWYDDRYIGTNGNGGNGGDAGKCTNAAVITTLIIAGDYNGTITTKSASGGKRGEAGNGEGGYSGTAGNSGKSVSMPETLSISNTVNVSNTTRLGFTRIVDKQYYKYGLVDKSTISCKKYENGVDTAVGGFNVHYNFDNSGIITVAVYADDCVAYYPVRVAEIEISRIEIAEGTKKNYYYGDTIDPPVITVYYNDGSSLPDWCDASDIISGNTSSLGNSTVKIKYENASASYTINVSPMPISGNAKISGTAQYGRVLTVSYNVTPSGATTGIQWYRNSEAISGATGTSYTVTGADIGKSITAVIKGTGNYSGSITSAAVVPEKAPVSGSVSIVGTAQPYGTLTADTHNINPIDATLSYQWYKNGTAIEGATAKSITLGADSVGSSINVKVTGTGNYSGEIISPAVVPVAASANGTLVITGTATYGKTLKAVISNLNPADAQYVYQWYRDGVAIENANSAEYTVTKDDIRKSVSVNIIGINGYDMVISAAAVVPEKETLAAPEIPEVQEVTTNSVTITKVAGYEYKIGGGEWQNSNVFTSLEPNTNYVFYVRTAETETAFASPECEIAVKTLSIRVTGISLDEPELRLIRTYSDRVSAVVSPEDATDKTIVWSSSNENVATVDGNGVISAVSVGIAAITAKTVDGNFTASCVVEVLNDEYTVTWNIDGKETIDTVVYTDKISVPANPEKKGYNFVGWTPSIPSYMPAKDLEFSAMFTPVEYTATFEAEGVTIEKIGFNVETSELTEPVIPAKAGYTAEWEEYEIGLEDIIVNAIYTPITYTATFKTENTVVEIIPFTVETESIEEPAVPEKAGYHAVWGGYEIKASDITVDAIYTPITYTATFYVDDEIIAEEEFTVESSSIKKPATPSKKGYVFSGWSPEIPDEMPANNLEFVAQFKLISGIAIKNNSGSKTINYGETLRLTAETANVPDNSKIFWYVDGVKKGEGETFEITFESGTKTVEVKLVDSNGNVLKDSSGNEISDSEKVSVNSSFWQKIVSFFKNLFGSNRTVVQMLFGK